MNTDPNLTTAAAELLPKLQDYFGQERWGKLLQQMERRGLDAMVLAAHVISIRGVQCPGNEPAWICQAAQHVLKHCGSVPGPQDHERLQAALRVTEAPLPTPTPHAEAKPKRGGKQEPAPVPQA